MVVAAWRVYDLESLAKFEYNVAFASIDNEVALGSVIISEQARKGSACNIFEHIYLTIFIRVSLHDMQSLDPTTA
jgi:hypothetical protein